MHTHDGTSVIVFVVHYFGISGLEPKRNTPISAYRDGPCSSTVTREFMQAEAGQFHVFDERRSVEPTKDEPKPSGVRGLDPCSTTSREEPRKSLVLEAAYHPLQCHL